MTDKAAAEKEKLAKLRFLAKRMEGDRWFLDDDDAGTHLISVRRSGETAILATFHRDAQADERDLISDALPALFRFFDMFDRARARVRELQTVGGPAEKPAANPNGDYTTEASIKLSERMFWRFLEASGAGGQVRSVEAADAALKKILGIESKKDLNKDDGKRAQWRSLVREFDAFMRVGS